MKRLWMSFLALAIIACAITRLTADEKQPNEAKSNKRIEELASQVKSLESKLNTLEQKLSWLEQRPTAPILPPAQIPPGVNVSSSASPKIWGQGECNGWNYYIIPLKTGNKAPSPTVQIISSQPSAMP
ncbi:hypothetical protein [Pedosphaera parvula]|uniref:Lipoprotein n=1 Tax=Pedosphaera parvula (strain Ellin514) TaxID=320771 RepID=B9XNR6_PEDPL|nr:hypothetical protein [Pedosphaera parvula]EEF58489.1 hypothetical protein Cflav_PD1216 [Pedosphaera parvula Ellin514]